MNKMTILRNSWLALNAIAVALSLSIWFGYGSETLRYLCLALNAVVFLLSLPVSLIVLPVAYAANYYLEVNSLSTGGIYFNTFSLLFVGGVQWFLLTRQYEPYESQMQRIG
jgi:hypothetical protein